MIFETDRLTIRPLQKIDKDLFFEMMRNPNVMLPIPQQPMNRQASDQKFEEIITLANPKTKNIWAVTKKETDEFIGICGFLINNENDDEIAYRLLETSWGIGYGTEIAKGLIEYGFEVLGSNKITADVNTTNLKSAKILEKFLNPIREFYNENDRCTDRRYEISKVDYFKQQKI